MSRPLYTEERNILNFLLSVDFPGRDALRDQAAHSTVTGRCPCGCATINLGVDTTAAPPAQVVGRIPVEATATDESWGLLLFVDDGYLSSVEIYGMAEKPPPVFPEPRVFAPPSPRVS